MAKRKTSKSAEVLRPAVVVDATLLQGIAMTVRRHIEQAVLPGLLDIMKLEAERGEMECLFVPDVKGLSPLTCCEALRPELHRRGMRSKIVEHDIPRLGMVQTKTALAVSWRELP